MSLLVTPDELSQRARVRAKRSLLIDLRPAEAFLREPPARRRSPRPVRHQQHRYRSRSAERVLLDHRASARLARRVRRRAGRRVRRHVRHPGGAGVLVSRVLRPSGRRGCSTADTARGRSAGCRLTHGDADSRRRPSGRARATTSVLASWRDVQRSPRAAGRRHPRHAKRRRVLRHDRPRGARRRDSRRRASRVDEQPRRQTARSSRLDELREMYEHAGRDPRSRSGRRTARAATAPRTRIWPCGCSAIRACATTSDRGRNGAIASICPSSITPKEP